MVHLGLCLIVMIIKIVGGGLGGGRAVGMMTGGCLGGDLFEG